MASGFLIIQVKKLRNNFKILSYQNKLLAERNWNKLNIKQKNNRTNSNSNNNNNNNNNRWRQKK